MVIIQKILHLLLTHLYLFHNLPLMIIDQLNLIKYQMEYLGLGPLHWYYRSPLLPLRFLFREGRGNRQLFLDDYAILFIIHMFWCSLHKADINLVDTKGRLPLHVACIHGRLGNVEILLPNYIERHSSFTFELRLQL